MPSGRGRGTEIELRRATVLDPLGGERRALIRPELRGEWQPSPGAGTCQRCFEPRAWLWFSWVCRRRGALALADPVQLKRGGVGTRAAQHVHPSGDATFAKAGEEDVR